MMRGGERKDNMLAIRLTSLAEAADVKICRSGNLRPIDELSTRRGPVPYFDSNDFVEVAECDG